ncbi:unnamed protein product [Callosobruchus maculatus]|nr:unnamed protein product [Callosobruchus maculatus]
MFRFERHDIPRLANILGIPEEVRTPRRVKVDNLVALCIVLRRLAYPNRLRDIAPMWNLSPQAISEVFLTTMDIIIRNNGRFLDRLQNLQWLDRNKMQYYAQAIRAKGGAVENCWGFMDGTARQICRPSVLQENYYSGHKRAHCLKFQSILCPDGIIANLKGPYEGRRHDAGIFRASEIYAELEQVAVFSENEKFCLFADQGYGVMELVLTPFPNRQGLLQPYQRQFNESMRKLRVAVEWGFQKPITQFAFVDFKKNQKILMQDVPNMYKTAILLSNCHTCLYGSQSAEYFHVTPPTLDVYFGV